MVALWWGIAAMAASSAEIEQRIAEYNAHAELPIPTLSSSRLDRLLDGEVVRLLSPADDPDEPSAAVAFVLSDVSRDALWIAAQDPHTQVDPGLTEVLVSSGVWYGHWNLPPPIRDRQWVVRSGNTHALARETGDRAWEHSWTVVSDGLELVRPLAASGSLAGIDEAQLDEAVFTPVNRGAWFMIELSDGQTLLGYQASSVVGGLVPTWVVQQLVMSRLASILTDLQERARTWSPVHYTAEHPPVPGGDGEVIPRPPSP